MRGTTGLLQRNKKRNKKASFQDLILMGLLFLFFSIVIFVGLKVLHGIQDGVNAVDSDIIDNDIKHKNNVLVTKYENAIGPAFFLFVLFIALITLVFAALIRVHPIFIPIFILGWIFIIFLSGVYSNVYQEMADSPMMEEEKNDLLIVHFIMTKLPLIVGILGILLMVIMYKTWNMAQ